MYPAISPSHPASLAIPDASTIYIDCSPQEMAEFTLPDIHPGEMRLVVGCDFARQPGYPSQHFDGDSRVVSLLNMVLTHYVHERDDVHSLSIYVNVITDLHWRAWLELVDPARFPSNMISLSIIASPFYNLAHVMQETHRYSLDELSNTTLILREIKSSANGMFLLAGNPMAGLMSSLRITKPNDSQYFSDYYDDHIQSLQNFLSAAANLQSLELPLNVRRSLVPLLQFCQELHHLTSVKITPSNDPNYDNPDVFPPGETSFLAETFASTIMRLPNLESLSFPAFLMSKQLLLALCGLPKLDRLTLSASPGLNTEDTIVKATVGLKRPLPKMWTLSIWIIEVNSGEEVRVPFHQRTKAMAPNAAINRQLTVTESNADIHDHNTVSQQAIGSSLINFRLS